jgi:hypothetical protein
VLLDGVVTAAQASHDQRFKIFISAKMQAFRDVRDVIEETLKAKGLNGWVFETTTS